MKYALLLLINVSAFTALDDGRVWRSRSDLSDHQCWRATGIGQMTPDSQPVFMILGGDLCVILLVIQQPTALTDQGGAGFDESRPHEMEGLGGLRLDPFVGHKAHRGPGDGFADR